MSEKVPKQRKRKAEDDEDAEEGVAKPRKKAKDADGEAVKKPAAAKKVKPLKLTAEDEPIVAGASMERNKAIAEFVMSVRERYVEAKEWIKASAAKKAADNIKAHPTPIQVARELLALPGCGQGTVDKVDAFLKQNPNAGGSAGGAYGAAAPAPAAGGAGAGAGSGEDLSYLRDSEREVVIQLLQDGEVTLADVKRYRDDIGEGDF